MQIKTKLFGLNAGIQEQEEIKENILKKTFKYEEDFEDLGILADKIQREKLTKEECDSAFVALNNVLDDINIIKLNKNLSEHNLNNLKEEAQNEIILFNSENFDIFGNVKEDKTKISILANKKHREIKKNKFKILDVSKDLNIEEYKEIIEDKYKKIETALKKVQSISDICVYMVSEEKLNNNELRVFHINPENAIKEVPEKEKINLHKINIKEGMNLLYYTNIMYYDNNNNTLPVGMNIEDKVLIDLSMFDLRIKKQKVLRINQDINEIENCTKIICVYDYELKIKE